MFNSQMIMFQFGICALLSFYTKYLVKFKFMFNYYDDTNISRICWKWMRMKIQTILIRFLLSPSTWASSLYYMHLHFPFSFVLKCCFKIEQQKVLKISIKLLRMCFKQMYNVSCFRQSFLLNSCHVWCQRNNILTQNDARDLMLLTVF